MKQHIIQLGLFFFVVLFYILSIAQTIEWYDVNDNSVLQVSCNNKEYKLVVKKNELVKKEKVISDWLEQTVFNNCKGRNLYD